MPSLEYTRRGDGPPLVLLHALGSSRHAWDPVIGALAIRADVIAVDLPGFGDSAPLPAAVEPSPAALAAAVADLLDELGIVNPHLVGNSIGGWVALELAAIQPVATVSLISPAGLWLVTPLYCRVSLHASRWLTRHAGRLLSRLVDYRLGRILIVGQTHGRPVQMTPDQARAGIRALGTCPGFDATLRATSGAGYRMGAPITAPVSLAFGARDWLLRPHQSRRVDQLPPGVNPTTLPGCGHVPMTDDPTAISDFILSSSVDSSAPPTRDT